MPVLQEQKPVMAVWRIAERGFQFIAHLAGRCEWQALFRYGRPCNITTQTLHFLALVGAGGNAGVQTEAGRKRQ